jgi:serine protease
MPRLLPTVLSAALAATSLAAPAAASATARAAAAPVRAFQPGEVLVRTAEGTRLERTRAGESVPAAVGRWRARAGVRSALPNYVARASAYVPNDPGRMKVAGGWQRIQWNFGPDAGVNAPVAWEHLRAVGRPGGTGIVIAVLDTGVAYANRGRFRRSPDFGRNTFVRGYDYVGEDPYPNDQNGHGTHVASTIVESADNGLGVTGLAYGARVMPIRVLNSIGEGDSYRIAQGIRLAAKRGVEIINLSFEFTNDVTAGQIPDILRALRYAQRKGVLVVAASGNTSGGAVAYPARADDVLSVGATTLHLCQADYSNRGAALDIVAPGGGDDAAIATDPEHCRPDEPGRDIYQMTFTRNPRTFGLPGGYFGTSMAAPHVSATAALVMASGVLGPDPAPEDVQQRLISTARDLGTPGRDARYGWGLIDAARATDPAVPVVPAG